MFCEVIQSSSFFHLWDVWSFGFSKLISELGFQNNEELKLAKPLWIDLIAPTTLDIQQISGLFNIVIVEPHKFQDIASEARYIVSCLCKWRYLFLRCSLKHSGCTDFIASLFLCVYFNVSRIHYLTNIPLMFLIFFFKIWYPWFLLLSIGVL